MKTRGEALLPSLLLKRDKKREEDSFLRDPRMEEEFRKCLKTDWEFTKICMRSPCLCKSSTFVLSCLSASSMPVHACELRIPSSWLPRREIEDDEIKSLFRLFFYFACGGILGSLPGRPSSSLSFHRRTFTTPSSEGSSVSHAAARTSTYRKKRKEEKQNKTREDQQW